MTIGVSLHLPLIGSNSWVHDSITLTAIKFESTDDACEHFVRLMSILGGKPRFIGLGSKDTFQRWLNRQPNKAELAELINLQEMVW